MKKYFLLLNTLFFFATTNAQDTIRVGNLVIVKPVKDSISVEQYTPKKKADISFTKRRKYDNINNRT
ncbi:MAG: hypothetical protein ACO21H_06120, partial [Sediminibacterium sp.]